MPLIGRIAAATARGYGLFANVVQAVDPFFNYVVALLHGDGTNGGQNNTFLDSSTNNFTITRNGNTTQGSFSPFSQTGWGNYFDGATATRLTMPSNTAFAFGTGAYTVEGWVYLNAQAATQSSFFEAGTNTGALSTSILSNGAVSLGTYGVGAVFSSPANSVTPNQWFHIAVVRNSTASNDTKIYVNGTAVATGTDSSNWTVTTTPAIGGINLSGYTLNGYISNLRVVKGTAVYTANFTPSLTPLTAISGTSLLTCQANRFLDASSNAFAITRNGDVSVQPFSPFNPTTPYSTSSIGGSGYFDGAGDNLDIAHNAVLTPAGDFTIEFWAYPLTASGIREWYTKGIGIQVYSNGAAWGLALSSNNSGTYYINATFGTLIANAWQHVVVTRSGNSYVGFVNGVASSLGTSSSAPGTGTDALRIGDLSVSGGYPVFGYMSGVRYVNGTAVYGTSTFTPPTSPPTAVTNTQLLTNFTNGAIFDNAAVADYETVGNAQISTSVKKYGTGSMAFDGTGDYLTTPYSQSINFGTGDFTIEGWFYLNSFANQYYVLGGTWTTGTTDEWLIQIENNGSLRFLTTANTSFFATGLIKTGTWYHFAASRNAGVIKAYINGNVFATITNANSIGSVSKTLNIGQQPGGSWPWNGYLDDWRVTKGIGRYPYNFTPPTAEFPNIGGTVTLTADPYFDYTTLLLPGNGTNGAQNNTFLDSSTNNFTITRNGNTTQGTFSPFSQTGWGNYFDGTGDYLTTNATQAIPATGDFTVDGWIWCNSYANGPSIISQGTAGTSGRTVIYITTAGKLALQITSTVNEFGSAIPTNQWVYFAITRTGSTVTAYINNSSIGTATNSGSIQNTTLTIGGEWNGDPYRWIGYLSNIRVSNVVRTITAAPTAPFTSDANTVVLTCQANRFIDASSNAYTITRNGDVSVQAFSPFNPTAAWSASTNGGSGYFDGSGDYLTVPDNAALQMGSGDFTVEYWWYPNNITSYQNPIDKGYTGTGGLLLQTGNGDGRIIVYASGSAVVTSSTAVTANAWNHMALVRSGTTLTLYQNGASVGSATNSTNFNNTTQLGIGATGAPVVGSFPVVGYLSGVRFVKGTAVYSGSTYTVPTAPLTAITNTSLLTNYTNAGIYDATAKNDLETVGNAQISTTQSKFGGSSMLFDGNGDDLKIITNPPLSFSGFAGDFTIEAWVYPTATGQSNGSYVCAQTTSGSYAPIVILQSSGTYNFVLYMSSTGSSWNLASAVSCGTATANAWNHIAVTRYGTNVYGFMNGILQSTTAVSTTALMTTSANWHIGSADLVVNSYLTGYVDDFRITKGIARYTSNFIPPTTAFLTL